MCGFREGYGLKKFNLIKFKQSLLTLIHNNYTMLGVDQILPKTTEQYVTSGDQSCSQALPCGVSQGNVFGQLLFSI